MAQDRVNSDVLFLQNIHVTKLITTSTPFVDNAGVKTNAAIAATKLVARHAINYNQKNGTNVVAETKAVHLTRAAGTIQSIEAFPVVGPAGGDLKYTIDVQKSTGAGAFSTILTTPIDVVNGSVNRVQINAALASANFVDGDAFQVVVALSGSTGTQGQGVVLVINADENPS